MSEKPKVSQPERPRFLTVREAAKILRVSPITLYRDIHESKFPAIQVRGRYVVPSKAVDDLESAAIESVAASESERSA